MSNFDYLARAEFFAVRRRYNGHSENSYKRFESAADAVRFAIEDVPSEVLRGAYLEVEEARFDAEGIRGLYDSIDYPLTRRG